MTQTVAHESRAGCLKRLVVGLCAVAACGLTVAVVLVLLPQDLSDVGGYGVDPAAGKARDLRAVLEQSVMRGHAVTLSEEEINLWLARELRLQQGGLLAGQVADGRVWVRLRDGVGEVVLERRLFGVRTTVSMFVQVAERYVGEGPQKQVDLHGGPYLEAFPGVLRGGRFGRLVVPQGYLHLIKSGHAALARVLSEESHLAFDEMVSIRMDDGKLVLDPRNRFDTKDPLR